MVKGRVIKSDFAKAIMNSTENNLDGVQITIERFRMYLDSMDNYLKSSNQKMVSDILKEVDEDVIASMMNQPIMINRLDYFNDLMYKSAFVAIYSFLESKFIEINAICKNYAGIASTPKSYKSGRREDKYLAGEIEQNFEFFHQEIMNISNDDFFYKTIQNWTRVRKYIVHIKPKDSEDILIDFLVGHSIELEKGKMRFTSKQTVVNFIDFVEIFLNEIISRIDQKQSLLGLSCQLPFK